MSAHNHGPWDGPGVGCPETAMPDGTVRGRCMDTWAALDGWRRLLDDVAAGSGNLVRPESDRVLVRWTCSDGATGVEYPGLLQAAVQLHREAAPAGGARCIIVTGPVDA